jgi:hypothetical protein
LYKPSKEQNTKGVGTAMKVASAGVRAASKYGSKNHVQMCFVDSLSINNHYLVQDKL